MSDQMIERNINGTIVREWPPVVVVEPSVPQKVTRRQARRALALAGLLGQVQTAIDAIADPMERQLAQIDWDDSQEFDRHWPLLLAIGQGLGLSEQDKDELFIQAGAL